MIFTKDIKEDIKWSIVEKYKEVNDRPNYESHLRKMAKISIKKVIEYSDQYTSGSSLLVKYDLERYPNSSRWAYFDPPILLPCFAGVMVGTTTYVFTKDSEESIELSRLLELDKRWMSAFMEFTNTVNRILSSVKTAKQLIQVWPEAIQFIPKVNKVYIPIQINCNEINTALGIK